MNPSLNNIPMALLLSALLAGITACESDSKPIKSEPVPEVEEATTVEIFLTNFERAMDQRDEELLDQLLDERFFFSQDDCLGQNVFVNDRKTYLECLTGNSDGSLEGIWDIFRDFNFDYNLIERTVELGPEFPNAFEGDPDGHPDEDWEVLRLQISVLMTDGQDNGSRINKIVFLKLRRDEAGLLRLVRWDNDSLAGDCSNGESVNQEPSLGCL